MKIRSRLVTTLIITGVIPLIIAISITHFVGIPQRMETIGKNFQQLSEKARDNVALMLTEDIQAIMSLSVLPVTIESLSRSAIRESGRILDIERRWRELEGNEQLLREILDNPLSKTLMAFKSVENAFGEIFVTDAEGRLFASTGKTTDYWQADEVWWQKTYNGGKGQIYLGEVGFDESAGIYSIDICMPVMKRKESKVGRTESLVGIIKGVLDISRVFGSIVDIDVGEGSRVMLASDDGKIMISRGLTPLRERMPPQMIPKPHLGDSNWFVADLSDSPDMLVGFAKISLNGPGFHFSTPWSVIVSQQLKYAFAPIRLLVLYMSLPGVALIVIFFFLGLSLAEKKFVSPLNALTQMARRLANGDLKQRAHIDSKDEIGELSLSWNRMAENLQKRISLDNISLNMLAHLELMDVLSIAMNALKTAFDAAFARVWLLGDGDLCDDCVQSGVCLSKERCLHLKVTVGMRARDDEYQRVPIGALKVGKVAETRQPSMTNNLAEDEHIHNLQWLQEEGLVSFAGYPLLIGDELLGVLALFSRRPISEDEFIILGAFVNRVAMAVQNARLHSQIRELNLNLEKKVAQRTQELEMANLKLRKADQLKSEFLANMSHELRTPLNAIIGFAEILRDGICGKLNEDQLSAVTDIHESGKHLLQMINDILDLSKVEAGKMELQSEEFSLSKAIDEVLSVMRDMVNKKHLNLQSKIADDLPVIYADQVKFKQIMYNLLSNAIKFTPDGGDITISAGVENSEFLISVTDTGIGIDPKDHEIIFDEFRQLDSSRTRQYEGTGLGLALTKRLVELHGGRIWVESKGSGMGSKFSFTLPMRCNPQT